MKFLATSTTDEKELLKASVTKRGLKELITGEIFSPQEIIVFQKDEDEGSGANPVYVAIKVDGQYYAGISADVVDSCNTILGWAKDGAGFDDMRELKMHLEKSAGKFGKIRLELD